MSRLAIPLGVALLLAGGFVWLLPARVPPPTRLERLVPELAPWRASTRDPTLAEGRARNRLKEAFADTPLTAAELREAWSSEDETLRWAAWLMVGVYGTPDEALFDAIVAELAPERPPDLRTAAAAAAASYGGFLPDRLAPPLLVAANARETRVCAAALRALGQMAPTRPALWLPIAQQLQALDGDIRDAASGALSRVPFEDHVSAEAEAARGTLVDALRLAAQDARLSVRMHAAMGLGRMGPHAAPAIDALIPLLSDPSRLVESHAATALGRIGMPALEPLVKALDAVPPARIPRVLWALRLIGAPALPTLRSITQTHPRHAVRVLAAMKIVELNQPVEPLLPVFRSALRDAAPEARLQAARGLERLGPRAVGMTDDLRDALAQVPKEEATLRRALEGALREVTKK